MAIHVVRKIKPFISLEVSDGEKNLWKSVERVVWNLARIKEPSLTERLRTLSKAE